MSYEAYKIVHLVALVLLFSGLVGLLTIQMSAGALAGPAKKLVFISHGIGWLLLLISGFGLAARLGLGSGLPSWVYGKLVIWLILGGAIIVIKRRGQLGLPLYIAILIFLCLAALLAVTKPL